MKRLTIPVLIAALALPSVAAAKSVLSFSVTCGEPAATPASAAPNLHGTWDFVMDVNGTPNFGLLSIGYVGDRYGGSLALWSTAPVVLRKFIVKGINFHMAVTTPDGDVLFDGVLSAKGDRMCGTVTYHGGRKFVGLARKRQMTYQSVPPAERSQ